MSLKSNYAFIRDWVNSKFLKKEDVDLSLYETKQNSNQFISEVENNYAKKSELDSYLTISDYENEEEIIAASLTDLDRRIEDLPNSGIVLGQNEEKVIAEALLDLNGRLETIEDADYGTQIANAGQINSVTLNGSSALVTNKVADLSLTTSVSGAGNAVTGVSISGGVITVTKGNIDVSDKESISNKVTSISSSSTDTQYPSAKCVYTNIGDVESVLNEIITPTPQLSVPATMEVVSALNTATSYPFRIYGDYLRGNVTLSGAANGITYGGTTSANTVAKDNALAGRDMTITYTPTSAGPHTATINFASSGMTTKQMVVTGTVVTPTITTNITNNSLDATTTATFTLSGSQLLGAVTLTPSTGFSVSSTSISKDDAEAGNVSITVTNNSATEAGTLTIATSGMTTITVTLNVTIPEI